MLIKDAPSLVFGNITPQLVSDHIEVCVRRMIPVYSSIYLSRKLFLSGTNNQCVQTPDLRIKGACEYCEYCQYFKCR